MSIISINIHNRISAWHVDWFNKGIYEGRGFLGGYLRVLDLLLSRCYQMDLVDLEGCFLSVAFVSCSENVLFIFLKVFGLGLRAYPNSFSVC